MPVKVLDAADDPVALGQACARPQRNDIALFARRDRRVRLVRVAPRRASVDEGLELPGNVGPGQSQDFSPLGHTSSVH